MAHEVILTPAYGRDYKSAEAAREAFLSGKDWILNDLSSRWDGKPCSKNDFEQGQTFRLRYNKLRSVIRIEL